MKFRSRGMSLVEVLIAVAVIGIIAVVGLPSYQRYIASAESSTCLKLIQGARPVADSIILSSNGSAASIGTDPTVLGLTAVSGDCDDGVAVKGLASGALTITGSISTSIGGNTMTLQRATNGVWSCSSSTSAVSDGFAPETCQ